MSDMRLSNPSPVLDKNRVPMGPRKKKLPVLGLASGRRLLRPFPDSSSALDRFQSATCDFWGLPCLQKLVVKVFGETCFEI